MGLLFLFIFNSLNMATMTPKYFKAIAPNCQYMFDLKFWNPRNICQMLVFICIIVAVLISFICSVDNFFGQ